MSDQPSSSAKHGALGLGCLALFAIPFAAAGLTIGAWALRDLWTWSDAQHWVETPATLLSAELDTKPGKEGGRTFKATAHYRYEFAGRAYESRRVAIAGGRDNVGTYQQDRARELIRLHDAGQQAVCYVDPENPSDSLLFRDFRQGHFALRFGAGLVFASVGFGLLVAAWTGFRKARREAARAASLPDEPWRWRDEWQSGRLRSDSRSKAWLTTVIALFWNAISWPAMLGAMLQEGVHWGVRVFVLLFPTAGIGLAGLAIYSWRQYLRWGVSEFELAAIPGVLGGPLAGVIYAPARIEPANGFTLRLACIRRVKSGDHSRDITLWEKEQTITRNLAASDGRTLIPVQFVLPYELPPSEGYVNWKLTATALVRGADYRAEFEPPVFRTAASSPKPIETTADSAFYAPPPDFATFVARLGANLEVDLPDRRTLYFPMMRDHGLAGTMIAITVVVSAIALGLLFSPFPRLLVWSSGAFGILMAFITGNSVLERTRLTFGRRGIVVENSVLRTKRREIATEHIESIDVQPSGTTVGSTTYQKIVARELAQHDPVVLISEIARREDAERLAEEIRRAIGLQSPSAKFRRNPSTADASPSTIEDELPGEFR